MVNRSLNESLFNKWVSNFSVLEMLKPVLKMAWEQGISAAITNPELIEAKTSQMYKDFDEWFDAWFAKEGYVPQYERQLRAPARAAWVACHRYLMGEVSKFLLKNQLDDSTGESECLSKSS